MKRRSFIKVVGGAAGGLAVGAHHAFSKDNVLETIPHSSGLPRRVLGRTGYKISMVGFSGLSLMHDGDAAQWKPAVHQAFEQGVNYYDVAPAYGKDGICEVRLGEALQGPERKQYYLACKTKKRDKAGCLEEMDRSLKRLKTDYFDVYQLHHLRKPEEVQQALGPGGAMETILKAKEQGKVRAIGFSAHTTKAALEAMKGFKFDTVMFPINFVEYFTIGFGKEILELAQKQEAAVLAIKPMSLGIWPKEVEKTRKYWYRSVEELNDIILAYRFALSQLRVVSGFPPAWLDLQAKAIEAVRKYQPITQEEYNKLKEMAANRLSLFKREEDAVAMMHSPEGDDPHHPYGYEEAHA